MLLGTSISVDTKLNKTTQIIFVQIFFPLSVYSDAQQDNGVCDHLFYMINKILVPL